MRSRGPPFDLPGWLCLALGFACLVFAVDEGANVGWGSPLIVGLFVCFAALVAAFALRERSCDEPLIDLAILRHPGYVCGLGAILFFQFTTLGISFLLPNFAQLVLGSGQTEAGSTLLFGCALGAVLPPLSGKILDRLGAAIPVLSGLALSFVAVAIYAAGLSGMGVLAATLVYVAYAGGQGLSYGNNMTCALRFLPARVKVDGNALYTTLQQLAGAMGTSVCAAIVNASQVGATGDALATATAAGTGNAFLLLVATVGASLACALGETALLRRQA